MESDKNNKLFSNIMNNEIVILNNYKYLKNSNFKCVTVEDIR